MEADEPSEARRGAGVSGADKQRPIIGYDCAKKLACEGQWSVQK